MLGTKMRTVRPKMSLVRCDVMRTCTMILEIDKYGLICKKEKKKTRGGVRDDPKVSVQIQIGSIINSWM